MNLVISPHLDDAVFSCGRWLAARPGYAVVTLFAGLPHDPSCLADWDARCGFASADEAIVARRREDKAALDVLGAQAHWLDFTDGQYGESHDADAIVAALRDFLLELRPDSVLYPLGLSHPDHRLAHEVSVAALHGLDVGTARAYEDVLYRTLPEVLQLRLAELAAQGTRATPARLGSDGSDADAALKARAVKEYASQFRALGAHGLADTALAERQWQLDEAGTEVAP